MSIADEIARDLKESERDLGSQTATIAGQEVTVIPGTRSQLIRTDERGNQLQVGFRVMVRASLFSTKPVTGDAATYDGQSFLVLDVANDPTNTIYTITLGDPAYPEPG